MMKVSFVVRYFTKQYGTHEDERKVLYKTKLPDGTKPNTNPKTNPNPKLTQILSY